MRLVVPLFVQLAAVSASAGLSRDVIFTFVNLECMDDPEPAVPRTSLPPTINRFVQRLLFKWYILDEESFVLHAKPIVKDVHEIAMQNSLEARHLENNLRPLRDQGLNEEQILDHLTRRYYNALQRIEVMKELAGRK
jgi:hypothetical protein